MGPMTGRAAGYCAGYGAPGYMNGGFGGRGMGMGRGRGGGRGWRHRFYATGVPGQPWAGAAAPYAPPMRREDEVDALKEQAKYFSDALEDINGRIAQLEKQD